MDKFLEVTEEYVNFNFEKFTTTSRTEIIDDKREIDLLRS